MIVDNSDLEGVSGQDKSFDSIASFTGDVTDKVGNVGDWLNCLFGTCPTESIEFLNYSN